MDYPKLRWGLISTANICKDFCKSVQLMLKDDQEIVAVASRSIDSANAFGDRFSVPKRYASYEELVKDPNVDVVYVGTPHTFHRDCVRLCLDNGKHVLCEKPTTVNAKHWEELVSFAKEKKLFLMEAMWMRYLPVFQKMESLIKEGAIGEVKYIHSQFGFEMTPDTNRRMYDPTLGGGALLDIGVYCLTFIYAILGKPDRIVSMGDVVKGEYDFQTSVILGYPKAQATVNTGLGAEYPSESIVVGTKGVIRVPHPFWCTAKIILNNEDIPFPVPPADHKFVFTNSILLHHEAKYVHECLKKNLLDSQVHGQQDTLEVLKIMDTVRNQIGLKYPGE